MPLAFMRLIAPLAGLLGPLGLIVWLALAPALASASSCGGKGERACCVLERVPSCDKGLKESGSCKKNCDCGKGPGKSIGMCVKDDDGPTACGGNGQRACCVGERTPSCKKGLVERGGCTGDDCRCGGATAMMGARSSGTCYKPAECGGDGEKPCTLDIQVSQGRTSCDKGLIEDFVNNRCVKPSAAVAEAGCRAVVAAMSSGKVPEAFQGVDKDVSKVAGQLSKAAVMKEAGEYIGTYEPVVAELKRIHAELGKHRDLFAADTLCVPAKLQQRLASLAKTLEPAVKAVLPKYSGKFHMAYVLNGQLAAGAAVQGGYAVVTDYDGTVGVFAFLGGGASSNLSAADSLGVQFYPKVSFSSFQGWGAGLSLSGGPPSKVFSGGLDFAFDGPKPVGLGFNGAIGVGALPVEGTVTATHAWKLWSESPRK